MGTGTSSETNPCIITFDFAPDVIGIVGHERDDSMSSYLGFYGHSAIMSAISTSYSRTDMFCPYEPSSSSSVALFKKSSDGKTLYFYPFSSDYKKWFDVANKYTYFMGFKI